MVAKGKPCIHIYLSVPAANEAAADKLFSTHEEFMKAKHTVGGVGPAPRVLQYSVAKGPEMNDPMDPSKGETGNILYLLSEVWAGPEDIPEHFKVAHSDWSMMSKFEECIGNFGKHVDIGSTVLTSFSDSVMPPCTTKKGDVTINISYTCPPEAEAEMEAFFAEHEKFMRETHTFTDTGNDDKPRMTSFHIAKCKQLNDPMDPSKGDTGKTQYMMSESYMAPEGVAGHIGNAQKYTAGFFAKFEELTGKYGSFVAPMGACKVIASF